MYGGGFYSLVETKVPQSGIIKVISGVSKNVCVLKCRFSKDCTYSAIDVKSNDCLQLNKLNFFDGEDTLSVKLLGLYIFALTDILENVHRIV